MVIKVKKIIITVVIVLIIVLASIILMTNLSTNNIKTNKEQAKTTLMMNYNIKSVEKIEIYNGDNTYYIAYYKNDNKDYVGIMNTKYELVTSTLKEKLNNIKEKNYVIGYKNDKIIYELKKENKDGIVYYYYDALTGELINKINMDR